MHPEFVKKELPPSTHTRWILSDESGLFATLGCKGWANRDAEALDGPPPT